MVTTLICQERAHRNQWPGGKIDWGGKRRSLREEKGFSVSESGGGSGVKRVSLITRFSGRSQGRGEENLEENYKGV